MLELSSYEQELGELRKNASLLDKKFNRIEQESASQSVVDKKISQLKTDVFSQLFKLETQIAALNQKLTANLGRLQKDLDLLIKSSTSKGPQPQINMDTPESDSIDQEPLTQ